MKGKHLALFLLLTAAFVTMAAIPTKPLQWGRITNYTALIAGRNVNMVSGKAMPEGDPYLQRQNEPSIAVSTRNPLHLLAGSNDYRTINLPFLDELPGTENTSAAPDAWLGVYKSIDGGQTWKSTLLPGFPQDISSEGLTSPIYGFGTAADPVVRSGPNGLFYYCGIAFDRIDRGNGVIFVSRFIDNNHKENVDTTSYIDTKIVDQGNSGQFIDKPWLAVDVPYNENPSIPLPAPPNPETGQPQIQDITRGNVYVAYSVFLGKTDLNVRSKILFARSTNSGTTWESPIKLSESQHICQGATIAIDPRGNGHVYVAWRRFGDSSQPDAIVMTKSVDRGATFSKPVVIWEFIPSTINQPKKDGVFDQVTTAKSFRTNDYPTMAVDNLGRVFIVWSQRGFGPTDTPPALGESRLVISHSSDGGFTWSNPAEAIAGSLDESREGHQFMPSLTYASGKLTLLWYDQRWDLCPTFWEPYIEDDPGYGQRHTIDVRVAQLPVDNEFSSLVFLNSIQVSRYPFLLTFENSQWYAVQLLHNMPNLPMFSLGTVPFMGDYIDIAPSPLFIYQNDHWVYNTNKNTPTAYHAVWTDNRDVMPPGIDYAHDPNDWFSGDFINYYPPGSANCNGSTPGVLNQNIYTSRISKGIIAGSPGNTKLLNILRSFVIYVKNTTDDSKTFTLEIPNSNEVSAYFYDKDNPANELTSVDVLAFPYSYVQKTVLVKNYSNQKASVRIHVYEGANLISTITLNPDPTNPPIDNPDDLYPGNPHIRNGGESHTPHIRNFQIVDWNYEEVNPNITTVLPQPPEDAVNPDGVTPYPVEGDNIENPHIRNPHIRNPHIRNPHIRNNLINPHIRNTSFGDIPDGSHMTDVLWTIENSGNTTSSFDISTYENPTDIPDGVFVQMIVFKIYSTPTVSGCELVEHEHQEVIANITSPHIRNAGLLPEIPVDLKPNEKCHVIYRYYNPYNSPEQIDFYDNKEVYLGDTVPDIEPEIPDTDPNNPNQLLQTPSTPVGLLVIPPQILPDGIVGEVYGAALQTEGGFGELIWTIIDPQNLPPGLICNENGTFQGSPTISGVYNFTAQVSDASNPPQITSRILEIRIADPLVITTNFLPDAVLGIPYNASLSVTGGFSPYVWTLESGILPPDLTLDSNGNISGTPTNLGSYVVDFKVADSGFPQQVDTESLPIQVLLPVIPSGVAYYPFNGNANDESGNGNDASVVTATLTTDRFGIPNRAYEFDGVDDYIEIPDSSSLDITNEITITAWVKPDYNNLDLPIVTKYRSQDPLRSIFLYGWTPGTQGPRFRVETSPGYDIGDVGTTDLLSTTDWSFIVAIYDGAQVKLYINGIDKGTDSASGTINTNNLPLRIGADNELTMSYFDGKIDNVCIYNRALSESEIQALYSLDTGLVAYYPFSGNAVDESGNGNDGAIYGGTSFTQDRFGNPNCALNFDGVDDYVELPNESNFDLTNLTIMAIAKVPNIASSNTIISKGSDFGNYTTDVTGGTGRPYYTYINTTSGNSTWPIASQSVPINQYFSVAFTHDYATGQFRGYLNGDLKSYGILPTTPLQNDENVLIGLGRFISVADRYFVGAIDEIRIYNRVLSETEIEALYFLR